MKKRLLVIFVALSSIVAAAQISGELKVWHRVTLTFTGPATSESATPNPFTDFRLQVQFTGPGGQVYNVPGFYAADGDAANTSAGSGDKWRVHFTPDQIGLWSYAASFRTGTNLNISIDPAAGTGAGYFDGETGSFSIAATDKTGIDNRGKGMVRYVNNHYLQFAGTGEYYIKGGADSPENFLGYYEFDQTSDGGLHQFGPHAAHWQPGDPTWGNDKGKNIIGAINYLGSKGMNNIYFLTYNIDGGDGQDTWPWTSTTERYRFDVSKLDQWEIVFSQMDAKGIQLHFVTTETENDTKFEGSASGFADIRKLYYRELVARFSHHHNVIWNIGEENDNSVQQVKDFADYIHAQDPYDHPVTVHTHGGSALTRYANFYGHPTMEATSIQGSGGSYNDWAIQIRQLSAQAGRKWAVYGDEQGPAVNSSMNNLDQLRKQALWGNYMGGGAGVEWYFGYQGTFGDIQSEDWTVAEPLWNMTKYAMDFFQTYLPFDEMEPDNNLTSVSGDYCFYKAGQVYAVYLPSGGTTNINLPDGSYTVKWYDPRNGGALQDGSVTTINGPGTFGIGQAPSNTSLDWTVLITTDLVANIPGDINNDGRVNTTDLAALVTEWLRCNDPADLGCEEILPVMAAYPSESIQAAAPTTGLVHHWKLDEATGNTTVVDSVSALNGVSNAGTAAVAGKVGNALWFDGAETAAGGEVTISNFLTTDLKTMTLAFWVKPDQNTLPFASIKRLIGGADSFEVVIQQNTNKVANNLYIAGGTYPISTGQLDDATPSWTHVAMTAQLSGGTVTTQIYMNGVLDTPTGSATATDWGGGTLKFGMRTGAANNGHFKGALDEIRIYNRILSASEIQDVYSDNGDGNNAPQVNAGPDQIAFLRGPTAFQMTASAIDDGKPLPPVLTLAWTVQSKPAGATVAFSPDTAAEDPLVTVDTVGVYVLRLTANDSQISAYDEMIINAVNPICSYVIANNLLFASDLSGPMGSPDCRVNFYDFVIIARNWLSTGLYPNDSE